MMYRARWQISESQVGVMLESPFASVHECQTRQEKRFAAYSAQWKLNKI